jgi:serine/threonine-protein kinase
MIVGATPGLVKRFDVEARSTASLQHPNIVTIYDFGDQDGSPYLVMEYLEGVSLHSVLASHAETLSLANKLNICIEVCNGLNYAHERGIIHRDIKPANIMLLNDGGVKIVDFGIARIGDTGISRTEIVGTIQYMSPEQFQSLPLDRRTDIFSTGVVLYQLLTGVVPFQAVGEAAIMYQIVHDNPPPLSTYLRDYPAELDAILAKALAKNREQRYLTGREFTFDLIAIAEKQQQSEVMHWLKRAQAAIERTEWVKAEDCLRQVLAIDRRHKQAHQLLNLVQVKIRQQRRTEQVRKLQIQADQAFLEQRYDDALAIIDQAIGIDETNQDLTSLRKSIQEAKTRSARFNAALRKAEEAHQAGAFQEAKEAVEEALRLEPQETSAKALQIIILKKFQEEERQRKMLSLLGTAREQITGRDLIGAFETLKEAELIDPSSIELFSLLKVVNTARDEQKRKLEIERRTHAIEEALAREDYAAAVSFAGEGLQRYPQDQGLSRLKTLAEKEHRRVQLKTYAKEQFLAANGLLESGNTQDALSIIENALQNVPGDPQLETIRSLAQERLAAQKVEKEKHQLITRVQDLFAAEQFAEATRILEGARGEFPGSDEIATLLVRSRQRQQQGEHIARILADSEQLVGQGNPEQAVQFLEKKTLEVPDSRLFELLDRARERWQQFQDGVKNAVSQGTRILERNGGLESLEFLNQQPAEYRESVEFQKLTEAATRRAALEKLDRELARTTDLDAQVKLAEGSFRQNPENEDVKKRVAELRTRKEQVTAIEERAKGLEAQRQYSDASAELQRLRQIYPHYTNLEPEIERLARLERQRISEDARLQSEQLQLEVQGVIDEGRRILKENGPAEAAKYVNIQSTKYCESPELRNLAALIGQNLAYETLEKELSRISDLHAQLRLAEEAFRQNPGNDAIKGRLGGLRGRAEQVAEIARNAQQLESSKKFMEAVQEWEKLRKIYPAFPDLELQARRLEALERNDAAERAGREQEKFQHSLQKILDAAKKQLQRRGASEAAKFLAAQPSEYRESAELKAFADIVLGQLAFESLERNLERETDPDKQVRLAEDALRQNPDNAIIEERLDYLRRRRETIAATLASARALEVSEDYAGAAEEFAKLRQIYPQYPQLDSVIRRLQRLSKKSKQAAPLEKRAAQRGNSRETVEATRIVDPSRAETSVAQVPGTGETQILEDDEAGGFVSTKQKSASTVRGKLFFAAAAILVITGSFVVYRIMLHPARISIRLDPTPADSSVRIDGVLCPTPCRTAMLPGRHKVEAEHDGYNKLTDYFQVERGKSTDFPVTLSPVPPPDTTTATPQATTVPEKPAPKVPPEAKLGKPRRDSSSKGEPLQPPIPAAEKNNLPGATTAVASTANAGPKPPTPYPSGTFALNRSVIEKNESVELNWNIQNASTVKLDGQAVSPTGSLSVSPSDSITYHLVAIGPGGEHDFDASLVVNSPAPKANADNTSVSAQDRSDIGDLLQKYAASYINKDPKALQESWPGVPKEKLKVIKESYKVDARVFFSDLHFIRDPDGRVRVLCTQTTSNQVKTPTAKPFTVYVNQKDGHWVIDFIPIQ